MVFHGAVEWLGVGRRSLQAWTGDGRAGLIVGGHPTPGVFLCMCGKCGTYGEQNDGSGVGLRAEMAEGIPGGVQRTVKYPYEKNEVGKCKCVGQACTAQGLARLDLVA